MEYGIISLVPVLVVIVTAIITKRSIEPLVLGGIVGFVILGGKGFVLDYLDAIYIELGKSGYFVIVFALFGVFVKLISDAEAINGFSNFIIKFAKTKKQAGVFSVIIAFVMFLDNFFSVLSAGIASRDITDNAKISREMLTFTLQVTACATAAIIPASLWGPFMAGNLDAALGGTTGFETLLKSAPFVLFGIVGPVIVILFYLKVIPLFGPMKAAELRAENGQVSPYPEEEKSEGHDNSKDSILNFILPLGILVAVTLYFSELLYGLLAGTVVAMILYVAKGILKPGRAFDILPEGFMDMVPATMIVLSAFILQQANDALGMAPFIIENVEPLLNWAVLPAITFLLVMALAFVTGSYWGMMAISCPLILPLALALDANLYLTIGALISGGAAGAAACFYGDSATLACGITKIKNIDFARTALPLFIPIIVVVFVLYLILGFTVR